MWFALPFAMAGLPVNELPGLSVKPCWHMESGYLPVSDGKQLFYWYHEATSSPSEKPWMLWLNGGPGCSSLGGMFTELGPFVVGSDMNLTLNPYAWNRLANVIFIEQPAGVGFSYPNGKRDDAMTAHDTAMALVEFQRAHSELQGRSFYIAGESYGGHYVPNTALAVEQANAALPAGSADRIELVGFAVGNGYTDWALDFDANVANGRYHALTSQALFDKAAAACCAGANATDGCFARCFWPRDDVACPAACNAAVKAATVHAMDGSIDIYDIYEDVCLPTADGTPTARAHTQASVLNAERSAALQRMQLSRWRDGGHLPPSVGGRGVGAAAARTGAADSHVDSSHHVDTGASAAAMHGLLGRSGGGRGGAGAFSTHGRQLQTTISPIFQTCIDVSSAAYLNRKDVQMAIHVNSSTIPHGRWQDCGNVAYEFNYESELPQYRKWVANGTLQILIYNGDADYILSHMGNAAWVSKGLGLPKASEWAKWRGSDGQVAGYFETYTTGGPQPFTFLTVKGAGHMVPKDRPRHALDMLGRFLAGGGYNKVKREKFGPLCGTAP